MEEDEDEKEEFTQEQVEEMFEDFLKTGKENSIFKNFDINSLFKEESKIDLDQIEKDLEI